MDLAMVERAIRAIIPPGQVTEVRALEAVYEQNKWDVPLSGYFNDVKALVAAVARLPEVRGVYFMPNPVIPDLLARSNNQLVKAKKGESTSDKDIVSRKWLLIDLDSDRPAGIPSTDAEHDAALAQARYVAAFLIARGWPEPIVGDSGNGVHLMYRIELPTEDGNLVKNVLAAIDQQFGDKIVKVDKAVSNASRIWRLYGTVNKKGSGTTDRPWRMATLVSVPDEMGVVAREQLEAIASSASTATTLANAATARQPAARRATVRRVSYGRGALAAEVERVASAPVGERNNELNAAAFNLGQLVAGGALDRAEVEQALTAAGLEAGLEAAETIKTIKSGIEAGMLKPRDLGGTRPVIVLGVKEYRCVEEASVALAQGDEDVYYRPGSGLVRVVREPRDLPADGSVRPEEPPAIHFLPLANLRDRITRVATLLKFDDEGKLVPAHPPEWLVKGVFYRGEWPRMRKLEGVFDTPVLRPDGSVWQVPGYDEVTGILFDPNGPFPPVPESPSLEDARRFLVELLEVVQDFPFQAEEHRAAWVAGALTPLASP